jgi:hemin uptake protein HemP
MNDPIPPERQHPESSSGPTGQSDAAAGLLLDSSALFEGRREVHIRHGGELYRLRITRMGKLILTK